jgi:hypothetical protein
MIDSKPFSHHGCQSRVELGLDIEEPSHLNMEIAGPETIQCFWNGIRIGRGSLSLISVIMHHGMSLGEGLPR